MSNYTEIAISAINSYISSIQSKNVSDYGITCPSGTVSNLNTTCKNLSYTGSYGNKSTTGYYITYTANINNIYNLLNFQFAITNTTKTNESPTLVYITDNTTASWVSKLTISGSSSGQEQLYIPNSGYSGCIIWFTSTCYSPSWKSFFGTKYGGIPYPCGTQCDVSGWIPPTVYQAFPLPDSYSINIYGITCNVSFGCYVSVIPPPNPVTYQYSTTSSSVTVPTVLYIYDININLTSISFTNFDVSFSAITINSDEISKILNIVYSKTTNSPYIELLNNTIGVAVIEVTVSPPS